MYPSTARGVAGRWPNLALIITIFGVSSFQPSEGFSACPPACKSLLSRTNPRWRAMKGVLTPSVPFLPLMADIRGKHRRPCCLGLLSQVSDEPTTFEPVLIGDVEAGQGFRVLPPDLWPHGDDTQAMRGVRDVLIKPGFGWGEGTHPTTFMCLRFLYDYLAGLKSPSVLDYGTGSGVLAIAARRLGAGRVVGVDKDDEILEHALENAELNFGEDHTLELVHGRQVVTGTRGIFLQDGMSCSFDVVVANMLAPALVRLAPSITGAVKEQGGDGKGGGMLVLSGMTRKQVQDVRNAYEQQGICFFEEQSKEGAAPGAAWAEWVLLKGRRPKMTEEQAADRAQRLSEAAVE